MANQKITDLRRLEAGDIAPGDLIPIVDVSGPDLSSPTGETKAMSAEALTLYVANSSPNPGAVLGRPVAGLRFDGLASQSAEDRHCRGDFPSIG